MACGLPTATLYDTLTITTTEALTTFTTNSVSSDVISGTFPSSLCAETVDGSCAGSTLTTLAFTYTTFTTLPTILTTNLVNTIIETSAYETLYENCSETLGAGNSANSGNNKSSPPSTGVIVGSAIGGAVTLLILIIIIWVLWRRSKKMKRLIRATEEEKRRQQVNVANIMPSPYPPPASGTEPLRRISSTSPIYDRYMSRTASFGSPIADNVPPSSYYGGTDDATRPAYSRPGYLPTDPHGGSSIAGGGMEPITGTPSPTAPLKGSPSSEVPRISPDSAIGTSVKARAAYQHRRPALVGS